MDNMKNRFYIYILLLGFLPGCTQTPEENIPVEDQQEEFVWEYPLEKVLEFLEKENLDPERLIQKDSMYIYEGRVRRVCMDGRTGKRVLDIHRFTGYH